MKTETRTTIYLEGDECRKLIAKALEVDVSNIIKTKYGFGVIGIAENTVALKMSNALKGKENEQ